MILCGELLVVVKKPAPTPLSRAVSVTRYGVMLSFLSFQAVLFVVGCVIVVGCSDVVISV